MLALALLTVPSAVLALPAADMPDQTVMNQDMTGGPPPAAFRFSTSMGDNMVLQSVSARYNPALPLPANPIVSNH
jgi:hypothetical protein